MKARTVGLCALALARNAAVAEPSPCDVAAVLASLDAVAAVGPVWSDYSLAKHPVVLVDQPSDTNVAGCAVIWRFGRETQTVALHSRVRMSTPMYGMWNGEAVGPRPTPNGSLLLNTLTPIPAELEAALRALGVTRTIVLAAPLRFAQLGALGRALETMHADPVIVATQLAVHETFHLQSQLPVWLDQRPAYDWPRWDVQPDRRALVDRCYAAPAVSSALQRELAALLAAWDLVKDSSAPPAPDVVRRAARAYVEQRLSRYRVLDTVTVPSAAGAMSCAAAEDVMELEEGAPQWMSYDTAVRAGVMKLEQVGRAASDAFYVSGTFQLWILQRLVGREPMRSMTRMMSRTSARTDAGATIFGVFAERVAGHSADR